MYRCNMLKYEYSMKRRIHSSRLTPIHAPIYAVLLINNDN